MPTRRCVLVVGVIFQHLMVGVPERLQLRPCLWVAVGAQFRTLGVSREELEAALASGCRVGSGGISAVPAFAESLNEIRA